MKATTPQGRTGTEAAEPPEADSSCPNTEIFVELRAEPPSVRTKVLLVLARAELSELAIIYGPSHPELVEQNSCIDSLVGLLEKTEEGDPQQILNFVSNYRTESITSLAMLKQSLGPSHPRIRAAEARIQVFETAINSLTTLNEQ